MFSDINECLNATNPCLHDGKCINTKGSFICQCETGWRGKICEIGKIDK